MRIKIVCVGTEVLTGKVLNTNAMYIANYVMNLGFDIRKSVVVGDNETTMLEELEDTVEEIIITTGGLGPTVDDFTKNVIAKHCNIEMEYNDKAYHDIKSYFEKTDRVMAESNMQQAYFPKGSVLIKNTNGTAPGCVLEHNGKTYICLPGPPNEMGLMLDSIHDFLASKSDKDNIVKGYKLVGIGESSCEELLKGFYMKHPNVYVAPYATDASIKYMFTSESLIDCDNAMHEFYDIFSSYIIGTYDEEIEDVVIDLLKEKNMTISTAESCTGGLLSSRLVNVSGASDVFNESIITYSNESKMKYLNVKKETLERYGAVSFECAEEMAYGLHKLTNSDMCVSVTGIAGPNGGTKLKPVGTVYFGVYYKNMVKSYRTIFSGNRMKVRNRSVVYSLDLVRKTLKED